MAESLIKIIQYFTELMKNQSPKFPEYIQKGYFVDVEYINRSYCQWEVMQIQDGKAHLKNARQQNTKLIEPINSTRMKPLRTLSKATENLIYVHRHYCYWGDGMYKCLETLKKFLNSQNLEEQFTPNEIVQFLKAKNYFILLSMNDQSKVNEQNQQVVSDYIRLFLGFFTKYWRILDLSSFQNFDYKKLHQNSHTALMMSWREIFIVLSAIFCRQSTLEVMGEQIYHRYHDKMMTQQLEWLNSWFIPAINDLNSYKQLSHELILKIMLFLIKMLSLNRVPRTNESLGCIKKLIGFTTQYFPSLTLARYQEMFKLVNQVLQETVKNQQQFFEIVKLKLKLTLAGQNLANQFVMTSQQKLSFLSKQIPFVLFCGQFDSEKFHQLVWSYLDNQNGLYYYLKNVAFPAQSKDTIRIFKYCPQAYIKIAVKLKRLQLLKLPIQLWSVELLKVLVQCFLSTNQNVEKQELAFAKKVHQLIATAKNILITPNQTDLQSSSAIGGNLRIIQEITDKIQFKIIKLCEHFYEGEKTIIFQQIQKAILQKYINKQMSNIFTAMQFKQTNNFRENFIFRRFLSKISASKQIFLQLQPACSQSQPNKPTLISSFVRLSNSMIFLKGKSQLEARKENLILILNKVISSCPLQFINLLCVYIQNIYLVQNRQFRLKALQFLSPMLLKVPFKNLDEKLQGFKKLMDKLRIENMGQFRIYTELFRFVNQHEKNLKMHDQAFVPIVIYQKPYGLQHLYDAFDNCVNDKIFLKKLIQFFYKIQLKVVEDEFKKPLLEEITSKLIEAMSKQGQKLTKKAYEQQFIQELSALLQTFLFSMTDNNIKVQYMKICQKTNASGQTAANPAIIEEQNHQNTAKIVRKYKLILSRQDYMEQQRKNSRHGQNEDADGIYILETLPHETLSALKLKACIFCQMSPIISSFYVNGKQIQYKNEAVTVETLHNYFSSSNQHYQKPENQKQMQAEQIQNASRKSSFRQSEGVQNEPISYIAQHEINQKQLKSQQPEMQQKQKQWEVFELKIMIKEHHYLDLIKQVIFQKRGTIFYCLPFTQRIWASLNIAAEQWNTDEILGDIKSLFLNSYTPVQQEKPNQTSDNQRQHKQKQQNQKMSEWWAIISEPLKRKYIFEALLTDPELAHYNIKWLFSTFTEPINQASISNNYLSLVLIQKLKVKPTKQDLLKTLYKMQINQRQNSQPQPKQQQQFQRHYVSLLSKIFCYIQNNSQFCFFDHLMKVGHAFYETFPDCISFESQFAKMWISSFERYLRDNSRKFLSLEMLDYLNQHTANFEYFVSLLQKFSSVLNLNSPLIQLSTQWLETTVRIIIENKSIILRLQSSRLSIVRTLLNLIYCLSSIKAKLPCKMNTAQFANIIKSLLYSSLCSSAIRIITLMINEWAQLADEYVNYFHKQMNDPELINKQYIKFNKSNLRHESGYVGLRNPHSICYVNSLLQQLYHIKLFREELYLTRWKKNDSINEDLIFQLKKIFINLNLKQCQAYLNFHFFQAFKNDEGSATSTEVQMDVDQFRSILFDRIQNEIIKPQNQTRNFVQKCFNGKQITLVKCKECGHQSSREEEFSSILLPIKGLKNMSNSLIQYLKPEILSGEDKYYCDVCKTKVIAERTNIIKQYPKFLIFVLKRFEYTYQYKKKVNERFEFPINYFDIAQGVKYRLKGIIVHQGLSEAGHYFSFIRLKQKWFQFNDNQVSQITEQEVINQSYGESYARSNRNAYLLFYQKVNQQSKMMMKDQQRKETIPEHYGLDEEIAIIKKQNNLVWKADIFLSAQFQKFVEKVVKLKAKYSISLLLQYITTIRSKCYKVDINQLKRLFQLLKKYATTPLISNPYHIDWLIRLYRNHHFNPSFKFAMTEILVSKQQHFQPNLQLLIQKCICLIHEEIQTSPFYQLFYVFSLKSPQILNFLINHRIIGRIYDISFPQVLLTLQRQDLAKSCQLPFRSLESDKVQKKKTVENSDLRYHKWKLINLIIRSKVELSKIEGSYIYSWSSRKCQHIFEQATTKANINQISKFFSFLACNNPVFNTSYLSQLCQQISLERSEHLRKYLKATADVLEIQDALQAQRAKKIKSAFAQTFKVLHKQKIMSSFDVKWQWFIKIAFRNKCFRSLVRQSSEQFKILQNKQNLQQLYLIRNINSQGKNKNKYYGLKFSSVMASSSTNNFLDEKFEISSIIFGSEAEDNILPKQQFEKHLDTDLTDFPEIKLTIDSVILKYQQNVSKFRETVIENVLGDAIQIDGFCYDRGDQKLMHCFQSAKKLKCIKLQQAQIKQELHMQILKKDDQLD